MFPLVKIKYRVITNINLRRIEERISTTKSRIINATSLDCVSLQFYYKVQDQLLHLMEKI